MEKLLFESLIGENGWEGRTLSCYVGWQTEKLLSWTVREDLCFAPVDQMYGNASFIIDDASLHFPFVIGVHNSETSPTARPEKLYNGSRSEALLVPI